MSDAFYLDISKVVEIWYYGKDKITNDGAQPKFVVEVKDFSSNQGLIREETDLLSFNKVDVVGSLNTSTNASEMRLAHRFINETDIADEKFSVLKVVNAPPSVGQEGIWVLELMGLDGNNRKIPLYTKNFYELDKITNIPIRTFEYSKLTILTFYNTIIDEKDISLRVHETAKNSHLRKCKLVEIEIDKGELLKDRNYRSLYEINISEDLTKELKRSEVICGNLLTMNYKLFYIGNLIHDNSTPV